jgi:hypothetical protein
MKYIIDKLGNEYWYDDNDNYHRYDGAAIICWNGTCCWYLHGKRHRIDGPAIEYGDGDKEWWDHGKRHRLDGPAKEHICGYKEWWINGEYISCKNNEEFLRIVKMKELL